MLQLFAQPIVVISFIPQESAEFEPFDQRGNTRGFPVLSEHKTKAYKIAKRIDQHQYFCCQTTSACPDGLILGLPFAPCPWR
jgi:hypothetical protein